MMVFACLFQSFQTLEAEREGNEHESSFISVFLSKSSAIYA